MASQLLPTEILHNICNRLDTPNILNFRLANRQFAAIGLEYIAEKVRVFLTHASLARFINIALHPVLKKKVQSITFSPFIYQQYKRRDEFFRQHNIPKDMFDSKASSGLSAMIELNTFRCGQQLVLEQGRFVKTIRACLLNLQNLEYIGVYHYVSKELHPANMTPFEALVWNSSDLYEHYSDTFEMDIASRLLRAIFSVLPKLSKRVQLNGLMLSFHYAPYPASIKNLSSSSATFEMLTSLCLAYPHGNSLPYGFYEKHDNFEPYKRDFWEEPLSQFLEVCPKLSTFILIGAPNLDSKRIFGDHFVWRHLHTVRLSRITLRREHMLRFFIQHQATLEDLELKRVALYSRNKRSRETGGWASFIPFLECAKGKANLNLKNFIGYKLGEIGTQDLYRITEKWHKRYPNIIPFERALRYLMCGQKTDRFGETEFISEYPYDWNSVTLDSVRASKRAWLDFYSLEEISESEDESEAFEPLYESSN